MHRSLIDIRDAEIYLPHTVVSRDSKRSADDKYNLVIEGRINCLSGSLELGAEEQWAGRDLRIKTE